MKEPWKPWNDTKSMKTTKRPLKKHKKTLKFHDNHKKAMKNNEKILSYQQNHDKTLKTMKPWP